MANPLVAVIEDEHTIAAAIAARLRAENFDVEVAHDGPAGVALCERLRPDLDVMLPVARGRGGPQGTLLRHCSASS